MTTTTNTNVWLGADGEYIGSTGTNSVREFAEAIAAHDDGGVVIETLFGNDDMDLDGLHADGNLTELIEQRLNEVGVKAVRVPARSFSNDYWRNTIPCEIDAKPGKGFIKSVGVSL
jgi:hypothetical protein